MDDSRFCNLCHRPMAGFNTLVWCNYCEADGLHSIKESTWDEALLDVKDVMYGRWGPFPELGMGKLNDLFPNNEVEFKIIGSDGGLQKIGCRKNVPLELPFELACLMWYIESVLPDGRISVSKCYEMQAHVRDESLYFGQSGDSDD